MTEEKEKQVIDVMNPVCCGLDVHRAEIAACVAVTETDGRVSYFLRKFPATLKYLVKMRDWLKEFDCPTVAMESTGVFWKPVLNVLEKRMEVILVNAKHVKNVPGRKTDISDCKWLAELLRFGLLKGSFIPEERVRQWRDLVTLRKNFLQSANVHKNRVHKLFETANIKLGLAASDIFGKTGRGIIDLLLDPEAQITMEAVEALAKGSLKKRKKVEKLHESIQGFFRDHHRFQLRMLIDTIDDLEAKAAQITLRLEEEMKPFEEIIARLDAIPGVDRFAAQSILGHVGHTLDTFARVENFVSWAGLCPGNNESAGKRKSGKSPVKKHPFKTLLVECAWAAKNKKGSFYQAKFHKLKHRIGPKKAAVAIAHKIGMAIFFIIKHGAEYKELGADYLDFKSDAKRIESLKKRAMDLGFKIVKA
jgi:transposase